jgi:hypothetical protein
MDDNDSVQAVQLHIAVSASIYVECHTYLTIAVRWLRCERGTGRKQTGTYNITVAVLKVVARELPFDLG